MKCIIKTFSMISQSSEMISESIENIINTILENGGQIKHMNFFQFGKNLFAIIIHG